MSMLDEGGVLIEYLKIKKSKNQKLTTLLNKFKKSEKQRMKTSRKQLGVFNKFNHNLVEYFRSLIQISFGEIYVIDVVWKILLHKFRDLLPNMNIK